MEDISKLRQYASILMHERKKLEEKILRAKPYMEGSLIKRYTRCGKPGCRCMEGKRSCLFYNPTCFKSPRAYCGVL